MTLPDDLPKFFAADHIDLTKLEDAILAGVVESWRVDQDGRQWYRRAGSQPHPTIIGDPIDEGTITGVSGSPVEWSDSDDD